MNRREFKKSIKIEVIKRATKGGNVICEKCGALAKRFQIDHVRPDGLLGEPVLSNAELICEPCFKIKNPQDTTAIAKAKRREAAYIGASQPKHTIKSAGFTKSERSERRASQPSKLDGMPPRRALYR